MTEVTYRISPSCEKKLEKSCGCHYETLFAKKPCEWYYEKWDILFAEVRHIVCRSETYCLQK